MKKILVVDNDTDILSVIKLLLAYNNYKVKTISKWEAVSKTIEEFSPDLILLDVDLGGADGGLICQNLKKSRATCQVPVVLISAHYMPSEYLKSCHAKAYISKPFEAPNLLEIVKNNLN